MCSRKRRKGCPRCNSSDVRLMDIVDSEVHVYECEDCGHLFEKTNRRSRSNRFQDDDDDDDRFEDDYDLSEYADESSEYD